jgi:phosphate uptake regulator
LGDKIRKEYNSQIEKICLNDKFIITPPFDPFKKLRLRTKADPSSKAELKMKIVSAYLQGYDELEVEMVFPPSKQIAEDLRTYVSEHTVPNLIIEELDETHYKFAFTIPSEISLAEAIKEVKAIFHGLNKYVSESLESFPEFSKSTESYVEKLERKLDGILYNVMRYLNKALSYVDIFEKVGLKDDRSIIHLNIAFNNLERLGDLHEEIIKRLGKMATLLGKMATLKPTVNLKPFLTYYKYAYETIPTAIDALEDARKGFEIIQGKISDPPWSSYKNGVLFEAEKAMEDIIHSLSSEAEKAEKDIILSYFRLVRHLTVLEGKLRAIPDAASNICEQAWNKDREILTQELYMMRQM